MKNSTNLDVLRAIAVLCVLAYHALKWVGQVDLPALGRFGVVLFFVHTSCVLMASLERLERSASGVRLVLSFGIRRAARIYPLCAVVVLAVVALHVPSDPILQYVALSGRGLLANVTLTQHLVGHRTPLALNVLWSLPVEVEMYTLLPFLYLAIRRHFTVLWLCFAAAILLSFRVVWVPGRVSILIFAPCFLAGVMGYFLRSKRQLPALMFPAVVLLAIVGFCWHVGEGPAVDSHMPRAWICAAFVGLAIATTRQLPRSLASRACTQIAKYSYGIYLTHPIAFWIGLALLRPHGVLTQVCGTVFGLVVFPFALFHLVERPMIGYGARLSDRLTERSFRPSLPSFATHRKLTT